MVGAANVANWLAQGRAAGDRGEACRAPAGVRRASATARSGGGPAGPRSRRSSGASARSTCGRSRSATAPARGSAKAREMRRNAKTILTEMPDPAVMVDHFERAVPRDAANVRTKRVPRVIVVRQPWFRKDRYAPEELADVLARRRRQSLRRRRHDLLLVRDRLAARRPDRSPRRVGRRRSRDPAGRPDAAARAEPRDLLRLLALHARRAPPSSGRPSRRRC